MPTEKSETPEVPSVTSKNNCYLAVEERLGVDLPPMADIVPNTDAAVGTIAVMLVSAISTDLIALNVALILSIYNPCYSLVV